MRRSAAAWPIICSRVDMPQPPQLVLPGRSNGSARSSAVWTMPPSIGFAHHTASIIAGQARRPAAASGPPACARCARGARRRRRGRPGSSARPYPGAASAADFSPQDAAEAQADVAVDHGNPLACRRTRGCSAAAGSGRNMRTLSAPTRCPSGAQDIDRPLGGRADGAHGDDQRLGVVRTVGVHRIGRPAAEDRLE